MPDLLFSRRFLLSTSSPTLSQMTKLRTKSLLFFLCTLALLLAACGNTPSANVTAQNKNSILTVVPSPKGDFTNGFSPYSSNSNYGSQGMIYETLLFFDRMNGKITPWLAQSYDFSKDAKTLTFHLRSDVKWSDGQT